MIIKGKEFFNCGVIERFQEYLYYGTECIYSDYCYNSIMNWYKYKGRLHAYKIYIDKIYLENSKSITENIILTGSSLDFKQFLVNPRLDIWATDLKYEIPL